MLLRDIFRFGTATGLSYLSAYLLDCFGSCWSSASSARAAHRGSTGSSCPWSGSSSEPRATFDAQSGTVRLAQGLERQCKHHRVPQQRLQVEQVVLELAGLIVLVGVMVAVVVDVQLLEIDLELVVDRPQAPHALSLEPGSRRARDQYPLHDRFQPQVERDRRAFGDTEDFDAQIRGRRDRR